MHTLMIVDDDQLVRRRVLSMIPFDRLELQLCAEAGDGIQALEQFELYHPQIVIMDINIPLMNGIDVAQKLLQENEDVDVIIITGFGTLDFAKAAIRGGMVDFLLKPINRQELVSALERIVAGIAERTARALERQRLERLLQKSMPLLQSRYFLSLMTMPPPGLTEEECRQYLRDFGITGQPAEICAAILCPDYSGLSIGRQMPMQALLEEELQNAMTAAGLGCVVLFDSMQRALLVAYGAEQKIDFLVERRLSLLRDRMRYLYQFDYHASIGCPVPAFCRLQESYQSAQSAIGYGSTFGSNNIVSARNLRDIRVPQPGLPAPQPGELMGLLLSMDPQRVQDRLREYLQQVAYTTGNSLWQLQQRAVQLVAVLQTCAQDLGAESAGPAEQQTPVYLQILSASHVTGVLSAVLDAARRLAERVCESGSQRQNWAIGTAKGYIRRHYADPKLNLMAVAENANLSPGYLSQLFKKEADCSFTDYLNRVRVEEAQKLLLRTNLRVFEIADAVGYKNSKYFFQVFRQLTGKRPSEFRGAVRGDTSATI